MARTKITAYVPPDLADALRRVAALEDRSISEIIEDALARAFADAGSQAEHAALMAKLEDAQRRLGSIGRAQETLFELCAHATRFQMSLAPDIPESDRASVQARGSERFARLLELIERRVASHDTQFRQSTFERSQAGAPSNVESDRTEAAE